MPESNIGAVEGNALATDTLNAREKLVLLDKWNNCKVDIDKRVVIFNSFLTAVAPVQNVAAQFLRDCAEGARLVLDCQSNYYTLVDLSNNIRSWPAIVTAHKPNLRSGKSEMLEAEAFGRVLCDIGLNIKRPMDTSNRLISRIDGQLKLFSDPDNALTDQERKSAWTHLLAAEVRDNIERAEKLLQHAYTIYAIMKRDFDVWKQRHQESMRHLGHQLGVVEDIHPDWSDIIPTDRAEILRDLREQMSNLGNNSTINASQGSSDRWNFYKAVIGYTIIKEAMELLEAMNDIPEITFMPLPHVEVEVE